MKISYHSNIKNDHDSLNWKAYGTIKCNKEDAIRDRSSYNGLCIFLDRLSMNPESVFTISSFLSQHCFQQLVSAIYLTVSSGALHKLWILMQNNNCNLTIKFPPKVVEVRLHTSRIACSIGNPQCLCGIYHCLSTWLTCVGDLKLWNCV